MQVKRNILLNPGPATTSLTVKHSLVVPDICPREAEFGEILTWITRVLPEIAHGENDYSSVLFGASGTGGLEAAISSAVPENGKLLIIENGAYGTRMVQIANTYRIPNTSYQLPYGDYPDLAEIEKIIKQDPSITHLAVVHHETTTGMLNPVQEICQIALNNSIEVIVDAMSSYAGIPINLKKWGAGYLVASSNKCIQGMPGLTFVIFKKNLLNTLQENRRSFYFDIFNQYQGFNNTGQMPFTPPVQVVYSLKQALNEYLKETEAGRWTRYQQNWHILYRGLTRLGFSFLLPIEQQSKILLAVLDPEDPSYCFQDMHDYLYNRGFTIYPGKGAKQKTFRLAIIGDLYPSDLNSFLETLETYIAVRELKL